MGHVCVRNSVCMDSFIPPAWGLRRIAFRLIWWFDWFGMTSVMVVFDIFFLGECYGAMLRLQYCTREPIRIKGKGADSY